MIQSHYEDARKLLARLPTFTVDVLKPLPPSRRRAYAQQAYEARKNQLAAEQRDWKERKRKRK